MAEKSKRYIMKVGEIFPVEEGLKQIEKDLRHSRKARFCNLRPDLNNRFLECIGSYLGSVECFTTLSEDHKKLQQKPGKLGTCKSRWYQDFLGQKVNMGEVLMPSVLYHVLWTDDKIHRIFGVHDPAYIQST